MIFHKRREKIAVTLLRFSPWYGMAFVNTFQTTSSNLTLRRFLKFGRISVPFPSEPRKEWDGNRALRGSASLHSLRSGSQEAATLRERGCPRGQPRPSNPLREPKPQSGFGYAKRRFFPQNPSLFFRNVKFLRGNALPVRRY
jgi:hypothetical protein